MDNKSKAGMPVSKIEPNFNQLDQTLKKLLEVCVNEKTRDKLTAHTYG